MVRRCHNERKDNFPYIRNFTDTLLTGIEEMPKEFPYTLSASGKMFTRMLSIISEIGGLNEF